MARRAISRNPALHSLARPRRGAQAASLRPTQAHHPALARYRSRLQGRRLSGFAPVSGAGRLGLQPHHRRHYPRPGRFAADQGPARSVQPHRFHRSRWIPGVNHLRTHERWAFAEFTDVFQIEAESANMPRAVLPPTLLTMPFPLILAWRSGRIRRGSAYSL